MLLEVVDGVGVVGEDLCGVWEVVGFCGVGVVGGEHGEGVAAGEFWCGGVGGGGEVDGVVGEGGHGVVELLVPGVDVVEFVSVVVDGVLGGEVEVVHESLLWAGGG